MNPSNLYEQYFSAISRKIKTLTMEAVNHLGGIEALTLDNVAGPFAIVLDGVKVFQTEQAVAYANVSPKEMLEIVKDVYNRECYIYYKVSSTLKPYQVVAAVEGTIYEPVEHKFNIASTDDPVPVLSEGTALFAPQYIILLAKTPEHYLATSSAKTNHYDLPVSVGPKMRQHVPYRNSPVKILSETETRLYSSYVGRKGLAEMKDRANSVETHAKVYENILKADRPTDIECLVDREQHPFGTDKAIELTTSILNASGIKLEYVKEKK